MIKMSKYKSKIYEIGDVLQSPEGKIFKVLNTEICNRYTLKNEEGKRVSTIQKKVETSFTKIG